jgi:LmbE family N-acetylglucosaminyl deacetylase
MRSVSELGKLLVISPHLDDAAFSCGELLACKRDAIVVTMFSGTPSSSLPLTPWDETAGFAGSRDAMLQRREEDRHAMELLHVSPVWLDFLDSQYDDPPGAHDLAAAIAAQVDAHHPDTVMLPAGLFHSDHVMAHQAGLLARSRYPDRHWFLYEDMLYRRFPRLLQERLSGLARSGIDATPVAFPTHGQAERKRHAVQCYASQLFALASPGRPGHGDIYAPEGYWNLSAGAPAD